MYQVSVSRYNLEVSYPTLGVTRGRLPQRAGSPSLNGGGTAAVVPPTYC